MNRKLKEAFVWCVDVWSTAVIGGAGLFLLSQLGWLFGDEIESSVQRLTGNKFVLITDQSSIYSIWLGAIGVHATLGALAPILGYTLLATNVTSASKIAPAGGVAALAIHWESYLRLSFALLVSSVLAILLAPSSVGLCGAVLATCYVAIKTASVFKQGFDLLERPEKYDASARRYLESQVVALKFSTPTEEQLARIDTLNEELRRRIKKLPSGFYATSKLSLGSQFSETTLVEPRPGVIKSLVSEAASLGCVLYRMSESIPLDISRGRVNFLAVSRMTSSVSAEEAPSNKLMEQVEQAAVERLQDTLDALILYRTTPESEDLARLPLLITRHVASVIQEALPNQRPHDAEYGFDVLGQVIDKITECHGAVAVNSGKFFWIYEIPSFVLSQANDVPHSRAIYVRHLLFFIRDRLSLWLNSGDMDPMSRAYIALLGRLVVSSAKMLKGDVSYEVMVIREIPLLARVARSEAVVMLARELILCMVDSQLEAAEYERARWEILKGIEELLRFSGEPGAQVRAAVVVSTLAVSLYIAKTDSTYKVQVAEVIRGLVSESYEDLSFEQLMAIIEAPQKLVDAWRWDWWELDRQGRGAHWMSMTSWITRAAIVSFARVGWRLAYLGDEELPREDVLSAAIREIDEGVWMELLPDSSSRAVSVLRGTLLKLMERRKAIIESRVAKADLSRPKVLAYVAAQLASLRAEFLPHNEWLVSFGCVGVAENGVQLSDLGVSRLLPKDAFVAEDALDIPILMLDDNVGRALVDFELKQIAEVLFGNAQSISQIEDSSHQELWNYTASLVKGDAVAILIIGLGVGSYDVHAELVAAQEEARKIGKELRFESVYMSSKFPRGIIVINPTEALRIERALPADDQGYFVREQMPLSEGGVAVEVSQIDDEMKHRWTEGMSETERDETLLRYDKSVLSRVSWRFSLHGGRAGFRVFVLPEGDARE